MITSVSNAERSWAHEFLAVRAVAIPLKLRGPSSIFVLEHIALLHELTAAELLATRRANIVAARQVAMYLARALSGESTNQIARNFGKRDHTTVMHACKRIADRIERDSRFSEEVQFLSALIEDSYRAFVEHRQAQRAS